MVGLTSTRSLHPLTVEVPMDDASEDENPEDFITSRKETNKNEQKSRSEREKALKKMMDDDDGRQSLPSSRYKSLQHLL